MTEKRPQILCVGNELDLLELRCAILEQAGYTCVAARLGEAETLLKSEKFDIIIVSARVTEHERRWITSLVRGALLHFLNGVTFPQNLLKEVSDLTARSAARMSAPGA